MKKTLLLMLTLSIILFSCVKRDEGGSDNTFIVGNGAEPSSIDPHKISGVPEHRIYRSLFEGLIRPNAKTGKGEPGVAERWTISDDQTVYTMKIRENAKWSDGVAITAETVRDSWYRILDPKTASSYSWFPGLFIKGAREYSEKGGADLKAKVAIRVLDTLIFQFETVGPLPYTIDALWHYAFGIVPLHVIEKYGADWILPENFVGNGPFVLKKWLPQSRMVVKKSKTYWDKDNVFLDQIVFLPVEEYNTAFNMFENKEVDWITTLPPGKINQLRGRTDIHTTPILGTYYYEFNINRPPLNDVRIRQALSMTIGRDNITQKVLGEGQISAYGMVPPMEGYTSPPAMKESDKKAKQLFAEAGFPNGKDFPKFTILYNTSESHKKVAEYVQQRWKEALNIDVNLLNKEWKTYLKTREDHQFDIARGAWIGDYLDPNTFLDLFVTGNTLNHADYASSQYDTLLANAARSSGAPRMKMMQDAENLLVNIDTVLAPIYFYVSTDMIDTSIWQGWYSNVMQVHPYVGVKKISK